MSDGLYYYPLKNNVYWTSKRYCLIQCGETENSKTLFLSTKCFHSNWIDTQICTHTHTKHSNINANWIKPTSSTRGVQIRERQLWCWVGQEGMMQEVGLRVPKKEAETDVEGERERVAKFGEAPWAKVWRQASIVGMEDLGRGSWGKISCTFNQSQLEKVELSLPEKLGRSFWPPSFGSNIRVSGSYQWEKEVVPLMALKESQRWCFQFSS